jgi:hypothetical protein
MQLAVHHGIEDYNLMVTGNKKLASKCDKLKHQCEGLQAQLSEARSNTKRKID